MRARLAFPMIAHRSKGRNMEIARSFQALFDLFVSLFVAVSIVVGSKKLPTPHGMPLVHNLGAAKHVEAVKAGRRKTGVVG